MGRLRWLVIGIATVAIASGIAVAIVAVGSSDEPGTIGSGEAFNTAADDSATLSESAVVETRKAGGTVLDASSLAAEDGATLTESTVVETIKADPPVLDASSLAAADNASLSESAVVGNVTATGLAASDVAGGGTATLSESAEIGVERAKAPPGGSGRGTNANLEDSVRFIVRDSTGKIKEQGVIE